MDARLEQYEERSEHAEALARQVLDDLRELNRDVYPDPSALCWHNLSDSNARMKTLAAFDCVQFLERAAFASRHWTLDTGRGFDSSEQ